METLKVWRVNPMPYAGLAGEAIDVLIKRDFESAAERLRSVIARERAIPAIYSAARENIDDPPKEFTDLAIRMSKGSIGFFEGPVVDWAKTAAGDDRKLFQEFQAANVEVVAALKEFSRWLEREPQAAIEGELRHRRETLPCQTQARGNGGIAAERTPRSRREAA